jgi:acyl carrier protein
MTRKEILSKISELLSEIVEQDGLELTDQTTAEDVVGWDSDNHVRLMMAIEAELGIRFDLEELNAPENVGALVTLVQGKAQG